MWKIVSDSFVKKGLSAVEIEVYRTNVEKKRHQIVYQWCSVIDYSEVDVWEVLKCYRANQHPCYSAGGKRCNCVICIFVYKRVQFPIIGVALPQNHHCQTIIIIYSCLDYPYQYITETIFSAPKLFAGIRELYPEEYQLLKHDEEILEVMPDNKCDLDTFVGNAKSCVYHGDEKAIRSLVAGKFSIDDIYVCELLIKLTLDPTDVPEMPYL